MVSSKAGSRAPCGVGLKVNPAPLGVGANPGSQACPYCLGKGNREVNFLKENGFRELTSYSLLENAPLRLNFTG